ncbi:MAG: CocE/NonD family hydrolase [Anaerolineae bacterium]
MGEYYGGWARDQLLKINGWQPEDVDLEKLYIHLYDDPRWLARLLKQFPQADADGDGKITAEEAVRWHAKRVPLIVPGAPLLAWLPPEVSHWKESVPTRDGKRLATEVYLPAGEGPFPTMVGRGIRKGGQMDGAHWYLKKGFACVSQDLVPEGEDLQPGIHGASTRNGPPIGDDASDLVEWVARQAWCNGKIAFFGYSAGGMATLPALVNKPPSLSGYVTHIASTDSLSVVWMRGGVAAERNYNTEQRKGWEPGIPPLPGRLGVLTPVRADESVRIFKTDLAGWFDIFVQGSINDWIAWKDTGRAVLIIGAGSHGPHPLPSRVPPDYCDSDIFWPDVPQFNLLNGQADESSVRSVIYYFLMGDFTNPEAPGNLWKVTNTWPIPHTAKPFYLDNAHRLSPDVPLQNDAAITYSYDPNDPVLRVDIGWRSLIADGPADHSKLGERSDVVIFRSEPLETPLEVTGPVSAELYISTDVPDTTFIVKLLDIYPDGYAAAITSGVLMARYHRGFDKPEPLQADVVYKLEIDMGSTAIVFDRLHSIGVLVTNSEAGHYAVHPNTYTPITSYEQAVTANIKLHCSREYPSHLVLPILEPGVSQDYDPAKHKLCIKLAEWDK